MVESHRRSCSPRNSVSRSASHHSISRFGLTALLAAQSLSSVAAASLPFKVRGIESNASSHKQTTDKDGKGKSFDLSRFQNPWTEDRKSNESSYRSQGSRDRESFRRFAVTYSQSFAGHHHDRPLTPQVHDLDTGYRRVTSHPRLLAMTSEKWSTRALVVPNISSESIDFSDRYVITGRS